MRWKGGPPARLTPEASSCADAVRRIGDARSERVSVGGLTGPLEANDLVRELTQPL